MKHPPTSVRLRENPPPAERVAIERRISLLPLCRSDTGRIDWPTLAGRLAEELRVVAQRLSRDPTATEADRERIERSRLVVRDYDRAADAGDETW